jgi:hypothetical protein
MSKRIDRQYFEWLISQIEIPTRNPNTYLDLFGRMFDAEFIWFVPHDDNRLQDGLDLRNEFLNGKRHIFERGASILEVLIALSRRVAFNAGGHPPIWAWQLIENLRLQKASDPLIGAKATRVEETLYALIWRTYERNGQGGFFPLNFALEDQTKREIWNQMHAYVNEIQEP